MMYYVCVYCDARCLCDCVCFVRLTVCGCRLCACLLCVILLMSMSNVLFAVCVCVYGLYYC